MSFSVSVFCFLASAVVMHTPMSKAINSRGFFIVVSNLISAAKVQLLTYINVSTSLIMWNKLLFLPFSLGFCETFVSVQSERYPTDETITFTNYSSSDSLSSVPGMPCVAQNYVADTHSGY